jgi:hypothetical protein
MGQSVLLLVVAYYRPEAREFASAQVMAARMPVVEPD